MAQSKFRYQVVVTNEANSYSNPISVFDLTYINDPSFQVSVQREKGAMYFYRKIKNKVIVSESDFTTFRNNIGSCYKYWFNIYKKCTDGEVLLSRAFCSEKNMEFDFDKCTVEIELQDKTPYQCFKDKKNEKFDVYGGAQPQNLGLFSSPTVFRSMDWGTAVLQVTSFMSCCDEFECYFNLTSDFFNWQDDFAGGTILPTDQANTNYVNNSQPNYYLRLMAKSDAKNPNATNPATKLMLSFDDIERIHKEMFNVYWVLEGPRLRWEHYSWFSQNVNYDAISATNFPLNKSKNKIKFNVDDLPERETFQFMEANGVDFVGTPIIYDVNCANGKNLERGVGFVTTETNYIIQNSASIANEGIVLVDAFETGIPGVYFVYSAAGKISALNIHNARLSWANLHYDLHRHGRPFITGTMNNIAETFISKEPDIIQEGIVVEVCCKDEYEKHESLVRTEIGDGVIDEADIDYTNEIIKFKVRHTGVPSNI